MAFWANIGNQRERSRMEECESNPLKDPHNQERPERRSNKIGDGGYGKKERSGDHEPLLGSSQKGFPDKGPQNQRAEEKDAYENTDLHFVRP